jgi:hypothetical protein
VSPRLFHQTSGGQFQSTRLIATINLYLSAAMAPQMSQSEAPGASSKDCYRSLFYVFFHDSNKKAAAKANANNSLLALLCWLYLDTEFISSRKVTAQLRPAALASCKARNADLTQVSTVIVLASSIAIPEEQVA